MQKKTREMHALFHITEQTPFKGVINSNMDTSVFCFIQCVLWLPIFDMCNEFIAYLHFHL